MINQMLFVTGISKEALETLLEKDMGVDPYLTSRGKKKFSVTLRKIFFKKPIDKEHWFFFKPISSRCTKKIGLLLRLKVVALLPREISYVLVHWSASQSTISSTCDSGIQSRFSKVAVSTVYTDVTLSSWSAEFVNSKCILGLVWLSPIFTIQLLRKVKRGGGTCKAM